MKEQSQDSAGGSFTHSNVTSFAVKVVIESMKNSKNDRVRRWGETAGDDPKALSRFGSKALDAIFGSEQSPIEETLAEAAQELGMHPQEVVAAAGQVLISTVASAGNVETQMQEDLKWLCNCY